MPSHRLLRCLGLVGLLLMLEGLGESRAALRAEDENLSSWPQGLVLIVGVPRQVLAEGIEAQVRGAVEPAVDGAQVVESGAAEAQVRKSRVEGLAGEGLEVTLSQAEVAASELSDATREPSANPTVIPSRYSERPTVGLRRGWGVVLGGEPKSVLIASHLVLGASDWRWEAWRRDASGWIGTSVELVCVDPFSDWASFRLVEDRANGMSEGDLPGPREGAASGSDEPRGKDEISAAESSAVNPWPVVAGWSRTPEADEAETRELPGEVMEESEGQLHGVRSPGDVIAGAEPLGARYGWGGERGAIRLPGVDATERISCLRELGGLEALTLQDETAPWPGPLFSDSGSFVGWVTPWALPPVARDGLAPFSAWGIRLEAHQQRVVAGVLSGQIPRFGFLGIRTQEVSDAVRARGWHGVSVYDVLPATPAAAAGLQYGDLITHLDGQPMDRAETLLWELAIRGPETMVRLTVARGVLTERPTSDIVEVRLASRSKSVHPETREMRRDAALATRSLQVDWVTAAPFFDEIAQGRWLAAGVWVVSVAEGSTAWEAGIRPDDLIVSVDDAPVSRPAEFFERCRAAGERVTGERVTGKIVQLRLRHPSSEEERLVRVSPEVLLESEQVQEITPR